MISFQTVYSGPQLDHPYGLAYFDNSIYWTEFQKGTVHRKNLNASEDTVDILSEEFSSLFEIRVFDNTSQTGDVLTIIDLTTEWPCNTRSARQIL
jgi:integrin beta 2